MIPIRGATTISYNSYEEIKKYSINLINEIIKVNKIKSENISTIIFSCTKDITKAYPGAFIREYFNLEKIAIMHFNEMEVENSLSLCIRVLLFVNYEDISNLQFVYLNNAKILRKDLTLDNKL